MSTFTAFERAKINRFINVYGDSFTFKRNVLNAYKEPTGEVCDLVTISGVYHDSKGGYVSKTDSEGTNYISKPQPMILCLQDVRSDKIKEDDLVRINKRIYKVIKKQAVGGFDYAWDISLELIDDGRSEI